MEHERVKKDLKTFKKGKCTPCRSKAGSICCKQVKTTTTLESQQTNETPFSIRLNNHRKDVKDPKAILADKHFQKMVIDLRNTQDSQ